MYMGASSSRLPLVPAHLSFFNWQSALSYDWVSTYIPAAPDLDVHVELNWISCMCQIIISKKPRYPQSSAPPAACRPVVELLAIREI